MVLTDSGPDMSGGAPSQGGRSPCPGLNRAKALVKRGASQAELRAVDCVSEPEGSVVRENVQIRRAVHRPTA